MADEADTMASDSSPSSARCQSSAIKVVLAVLMTVCWVGLTPTVAAAATKPGRPVITGLSPGKASVTVTWTAPANTGGSAITGYVVIPYIGTTAQPARSFASAATTQTITGLTNGATYRFKVRARNAVGLSTWSALSATVTPFSVPAAPTVGTVAAAVASVIVSWTAPADTGGSPITSYLVTPYLGSVAQPTRSFASTATTQTITGLTNGATYRFKVRARSAVGVGAFSAASATSTPVAVVATPTITVFGNQPLEFGKVGLAQPDVNVIGRVSPTGSIRSMTYELNGADPVAMGIGLDTRRLTNPGDFNVAIPASSLQVGLNTVRLRAVNTVGVAIVSDVTARFTDPGAWTMPYTVHWSTAPNLHAVVQPVDGEWLISGGTVRTVEVGYDRLLAVGDGTWTNFEATVPITVHSVDPDGYTPTSGSPGIGFITHWIGHDTVDGLQPHWGFAGRFGGIAWYRYPTAGSRLELRDGNAALVAKDTTGKAITSEVIYVYKVRAESGGPGQGPKYQLKVWQAGTTEPAAWDLSARLPLGAVAAGSLLLVAHHVDASFGTLQVRALGAAELAVSRAAAADEVVATPIPED